MICPKRRRFRLERKPPLVELDVFGKPATAKSALSDKDVEASVVADDGVDEAGNRVKPMRHANGVTRSPRKKNGTLRIKLGAKWS
jgi:hypothetical protein